MFINYEQMRASVVSGTCLAGFVLVHALQRLMLCASKVFIFDSFLVIFF